MIVTSYYNKQNKVLILTSLDQKVCSQETEENITYLLDKDKQVIGANIFDDLKCDSGLCKIPEKYEFIKTRFDSVEESFVYGEILSCEKHPKSDKLQICSVNIGEKIIQIVCGASNCAANNIAIVAKVGAVMPTGMNIISSKVMGVESNGMMCSEFELGFINEVKSGIKLYDLGTKIIGSGVLR